MRKIYLKKSRKGTALVMSMFIGIIAVLMTIVMMCMSETNTTQIVDNRVGTSAYYAAESGLEDIKNYFNHNITRLTSGSGTALADLPLPEEGAPVELANNSQYWVSSLTYANSNQTAVVEIVGSSNNSFRKIRAKLQPEIPAVFNNYGLLTDGILTINGTKQLYMNIHGNGGVRLQGQTTYYNDAVATQSSDPTPGAGEPGYVPEVYVPVIPINTLRTQSQAGGILLDIDQRDLNARINSAPAGSKIYITANNHNINQNDITISGNMNGKTLFLDGNVSFNIPAGTTLSNLTVVSSGRMVVNGYGDVTTAHPDKIDVVFAAGDDVDLNGSRTFTSLFWTNGRFTQNGASLSGRVIADEAIFLNGSFILTSSNPVADKDIFDKVVKTASWQQIPME